MLDLRIVGGETVSGRGSVRLDIGVSDGRIAGLWAPGTAPSARHSIAADGLLVLPGIVDAHFHCRAPGYPEREDFDSGTQAAAAGGATTILEMPIAWPGVANAETFRERRNLGMRDAHVDFGLWGGGGAAKPELLAMADEGAVGYKIFLHAPRPGTEKEFEGLTVLDNMSLFRAMGWIASTRLPLAIHCEDYELIKGLSAELRAAGKVSPETHEKSRPDFVEALAISKVLIIAEATGARIYFPHIGSARALEYIAAGKRRGLPVTLETCPHYLVFDDSMMRTFGPFAKINPPLRPRGSAEALWDGIRSGAVDVVGSDHAPYKHEEIEVGWHNIFDAPAGMPSIETAGPVLWDAALAGRLTMSRAVEVLSERPAEVFGLAARKGFIRPGSDADFVLLDPTEAWTVDTARLFTRSRASAKLMHGRSFKGRIRATYVRGEPAYESGRIQNEPGFGDFVRPHSPHVR